MSTGERDVLDRIELGIVPAGTYWHVYPASHAATSSNPNSKARLAWRDGAHGMFYVGDTPAAALWETALRYASVKRGRVYTDQVHWKSMALARLTLKVDVPVIDLRAPHRRAVVNPHSALDSMWEGVLKTPHHDETHGVAASVMTQLERAGHDAGVALRWHSRQAGSGSVILFFEPPMSSACWSHEPRDVYPLIGPTGQEQILLALRSQGLKWMGMPAEDGFETPPGDTSQVDVQSAADAVE